MHSHKAVLTVLALQVLVFSFLLPLPTVAQVAGGTISGTITDSSNALVRNAQISVKNKDTDSTREVSSNNDGFYSVPNLAPGDYLVTVSVPGFEKTVAQIDLTVGAKQLLNLTIRPGKVTQKVDVTQSVPTVDLSTSSISGVVTGREVRELPLNGRSWVDLVTLQPGVNVPTSLAPPTSDERPDRGYGAQVSINGARPQQNNYRLDGISVNDNTNGAPGSVLGGTLGVDAIQEFSVLTVNYSAEYGRTAGGVVNAVTRSGTNEFHGSAYDFLRNDVLDARNYFDLQPKRPAFRRNQFGGAAGGPIWKDHTFIFGDYEGIRQAKGISSNSTVPSAAAWGGNLCSVPDGTCTPKNITVDPAAVKYQPLFPLPNAGLLSGGDIGQYNFAPNDVTHENFFTTRVDHKLTNSDNLFGTFVYEKATDASPDPLNIVNFGSITKHDQVILEETHSFSTTLVNSLRFGFNRAVTDSFGGLSAINPAAKDASLAAIPGQFAAQVNISGVTHMQGGVAPNKNYIWNSYQVYDDAFFTHGRHSLKFGFAAERMQLSVLLTTAPTGSFSFGTLEDFLTNGHDTNPFISFQGDFPSSSIPRYLRQSLFGGYVQDDWRLSSTLMLNLGVRYEMTTVPTALQNRLATLINPTDPTPHLGNPFYLNPTLHNFEPRIGFAWDPFNNGKTAVRGGFGMFDVLPLPYEFAFLTRASPYFLTGSASGLPPGSFFSGAFPLLGANSVRQTLIQHNPPRNYVMQWNLNLQRELVKNSSVLVAYVGSRGVHQPFRADDMNAVLPCNLLAQPGCPPAQVLAGQGLFWPTPIASGTVINPNFGQTAGFRWGGDSYYNALELQVNHRVGRQLQLQGAFTWSKSIDTSSSSLIGDAFQTTVSSPYWWDTKYGRGLSDFDIRRNLVINATWELPVSKSLSGPVSYLATGWQLSTIFKAAGGTPFTPTFGTDGDPLGLNSGDPFDYPSLTGGPGCKSLTNPGNPNHYIKTECFAIPTASPALYPFCDTSVHGLNPPAPECFNLRGNAGRNILTGPGFTDLDFSVVKNNYIRAISESFNLQFRAEIFNILNHPNFISNKHNDIFDSTGAPVPTAGVLGSTVLGNERQVQFALKVIW
jgi:hypothetical protein